jgi:ABC-2 type transport system ATP-binding protein
MPAAAAETVDLHKRYAGRSGEVHALRGVSLRIEPGEIFALLGPNGAGKTTWISIVCGLVRATSGRALVFGHDIAADALAARRHIGLVPQEVNFDPFFTAREVLRFQMGYYGQRPDDARIDDVLGAMNLAEKADVNTRELSGGMRRRLLIAKALVHRPRIAFLDEPTAGVDVALRRDLWAYVKRLRDEGTTIVLTTHYLEEAEALADRVAVIDHGRLITLDTPARLVAAHGRSHVRFTFAAPLDAVPPSLAAFGAVLDNKSLLVPIPDGGPAPLLAAAAALPTPVVELRTEQPSLEDVFLALTGGRA